MASFWRGGKSGRDARRAFYAGGGFCRRHAWLLHRSVEGGGAPIADVYGALADRDLEWLDGIIERRRKRARRDRVERASRCSACIAAEDALSRKAYFLVALLHTGSARDLYRDSDGLCFSHLLSTVELSPDEETDVVSFLFEDWRRRYACDGDRSDAQVRPHLTSVCGPRLLGRVPTPAGPRARSRDRALHGPPRRERALRSPRCGHPRGASGAGEGAGGDDRGSSRRGGTVAVRGRRSSHHTTAGREDRRLSPRR